MAIAWPEAPRDGRLAIPASGRASRGLAALLVVSLFVTHWRVEIAGLHFLPEHFVVAGLLAALFLERRWTALWAAATDRTVLALGAFIAWNALVSLIQAPDLGESLAVVGWLGLDWLILVALIATFSDSEDVERLAVGSATVLGAIAVVLGVLAAVAGTKLGTRHHGGAGEARPVFALSYEANILASTLAIWAFVGLTSSYPRIRRWARLCVPLALGGIAFSLTRAVIIAFAVGLFAWALIGGRRAARTMTKVVAATLVVGLLAVAVVPSAAAPVRQRLGHLLDFGSGTSAKRGTKVSRALSDLGGPQLVIGLGTDSYGQRHRDPDHPHYQDYTGVLPVQIIYDGGLIGVGLLLLALYTTRPFSRPGRARAVGALLIYGIAATATSPFWLGSSWLLIALAVITRPGGGPLTRAIEARPIERVP